MGRQTIYNRDTADAILLRLQSGEALAQICRDKDMPVRSTVSLWRQQDIDGFADRYARAREEQAHVLAEQLLEVADDGSNDWMKANDPNNPGYLANGEHIQRSRLRYDARKWLASKLLSKVYGDKVTQEVSGADGAPLFPALNVTLNSE